MYCEYFGKCGSCKLYDLSYDEQISQKKEYIKELFGDKIKDNFEFFPSKDVHYRNRAEFRIWHEGEKIYYGMHKLEGKGILKINECPKVDESIYSLMPELKKSLQESEELRNRLYAIEFLSSVDSILVTLIYHRPIGEDWKKEAINLENKFGIYIIGRAKKLKETVTQDFVIESLHVEGKKYLYKIIEGGFSQPNRGTNEKMLEWVCKRIKETKDLLELYCGHGNFTLPLSSKFESVLATEISKTSIKSALYSCKLNDIDNIKFLRMSVEELTRALKKEQEFNRLKDIDLDRYNFTHVFVDPPRAGIDEKSLEFISQFENIIYISCNPATLNRDLDILLEKFNIIDFAVFDQFPYTNHIESGIILRKKGKNYGMSNADYQYK